MRSPTTTTPDGRQYIAALTGMRGIAAMMVFLFHYEVLNPGLRFDLWVPFFGPILQFPLGLGGFGVDIFFVLSGFLLTLPFAHSTIRAQPLPSLPQYFKRRFLRVFPAYYAQLFIILLVGAWFVTWVPQTVPSFLAHLLMFFNIGWDPVSPMVGVWWTLPVEMGFYLVLPLLAPFLHPRRWIPVLLAGIVISLVFRSWAAAHFGPLGSGQVVVVATQLPGSITEFLFGASAALLVQLPALKERPRPAPWVLDLFVVLGLAVPGIWLWQVVLPANAEYWLGHWSMVVAPFALGLPLSLAILGIYWGSRLGKVLFANRVTYFLGIISYSLYLWHLPVLQQAQFLIGERYDSLPNWVTLPLLTVAVITVATANYYLVERPFYRLRSFRQVKGG